MLTNNEHKTDRQSPKSFWTPNTKVDKIVYMALLILTIALILKFG